MITGDYAQVSIMGVVLGMDGKVKYVRYRCGHERIYGLADFQALKVFRCEECARQAKAERC